MVDRSPFEVGRNIANSPGAVVLRTEVFELIRYTPQTPKVRSVPVLFVPPTINKFYAIDLASGRSLVEYLVGQGQQVFVMSWRNPQAVARRLERRHLRAGGPRRSGRGRTAHRVGPGGPHRHLRGRHPRLA